MTELRHAPATLRNRDAILAVLQRILSHGQTALPQERRLLLEIASGTGEHAAWMTPRLPGWTWQPSDADTAALADIDGHARQSESSERILPAIRLDVLAPDWPVKTADAILCCNMIHIAPWAATEGLMRGAARALKPDAKLILYGPFRRHGEHTAPSNAKFDAEFLRARNPDWGVRCLDTEVQPEAARHRLEIAEVVEMPANNMTVVFGKG